MDSTMHCFASTEGYPGQGVFSLFEDRAGAVWIGSADGLYKRSSTGTEHYVSAKSSPRVDGISEQPDGTILVATPSDGIERLAGQTLANCPGMKNVVGMMPRSLLHDRNGALWIGTFGHGLFYVHQGHVENFTHLDGLSSDTVLSLFEDKEGNVWVGTQRGLDQFRELPVTILSTREGLSSNNAGSLTSASSGGVWIGTTAGVNRVRADGKITIYDKRAGLPTVGVGSILEDPTGALWIGSSAGLVSNHGGRFQILASPASEVLDSIAASAIDRDGTIWFSDTDVGLIRAKPGRIEEILPWSMFENKQAWALERDPNGGLWLGFAQGGIAHYRAGEPVRWYTSAQGLGEGAVTDLRAAGDGVLWIATPHGLGRWKDGKITTISVKNGLPCEAIQSLVEDEQHAMWLCGPCGLIRLTAEELSKWASTPDRKIQAKLYGWSDGVRPRSSVVGYSPQAARSNDGRLWFTVLDGVAVVNPARLSANRVVPEVTIERIVADGKEYAAGSQIRLPSGVKDVEIDFTDFSLVDPDRNRFRYKLEGYQSDWSQESPHRRARFSNLPPRPYRFRVIGSNNDGVWNEAGASFGFSITPAIYQTLWFWIAAGAMTIALLWTAYRVRLHQVQTQIRLLYEERLDERTRIARELHDTLFQNISAFALQLDGLSKTVREPESAKEQLRELRREAEGWLRKTRESVSDLRNGAFQMPGFAVQLACLGERITANSGARFGMTCTDEPRSLSPELQEHLLKIVEEAVRNGVRHAHASEIGVTVSVQEPNQLSVRIQDNGIGFDVDSKSLKPGHWGLISIRERALAIGGELHIMSNPSTGTTIEINVGTKAKWKLFKTLRSSESVS